MLQDLHPLMHFHIFHTTGIWKQLSHLSPYFEDPEYNHLPFPAQCPVPAMKTQFSSVLFDLQNQNCWAPSLPCGITPSPTEEPILSAPISGGKAVSATGGPGTSTQEGVQAPGGLCSKALPRTCSPAQAHGRSHHLPASSSAPWAPFSFCVPRLLQGWMGAAPEKTWVEIPKWNALLNQNTKMKNYKQILHLHGKHKTTPRPTKNQDDLGERGRCRASLGKEAGKAP